MFENGVFQIRKIVSVLHVEASPVLSNAMCYTITILDLSGDSALASGRLGIYCINGLQEVLPNHKTLILRLHIETSLIPNKCILNSFFFTDRL